MTDNLVERLREEWLRKATSSFTCQECGIQANFIDEILDALDAKDKRIAELEAALTPFARYATADGLPDGFLRVPDGHPALFNGLGDNCRTVATIGDFRRARALLASSLPDKEDRNG